MLGTSVHVISVDLYSPRTPPSWGHPSPFPSSSSSRRLHAAGKRQISIRPACRLSPSLHLHSQPCITSISAPTIESVYIGLFRSIGKAISKCRGIFSAVKSLCERLNVCVSSGWENTASWKSFGAVSLCRRPHVVDAKEGKWMRAARERVTEGKVIRK